MLPMTGLLYGANIRVYLEGSGPLVHERRVNGQQACRSPGRYHTNRGHEEPGTSEDSLTGEEIVAHTT